MEKTIHEKLRQYLIRTEVLTNLVLVPLAVFFIAIASGMGGARILWLIGSAALAAGSLAILANIARWKLFTNRMKAIVDCQKAGEGEARARQVYYEYLGLVRWDGWQAVLRWGIGIALAAIVFGLTAGFVLSEVLAFSMLYLFCIPVTLTITRLACGNLLNDFWDLQADHSFWMDRFEGTREADKDHRKDSLVGQVLMTIIAVTNIPAIIFGYLLVAAEFGIIDGEHELVELMVVAGLTILNIWVVTREWRKAIHFRTDRGVSNLEAISQNLYKMGQITIPGRDELAHISNQIGLLARVMDKYQTDRGSLSKELSELTERLTTNAGVLAENTENQAASLVQVSSTAEEVSGNIASVNNNIQQQVRDLKTLFDILGNLSQNIKQMVDQAGATHDRTEEISGQAEKGGQLLQTMSGAMGAIQESSAEMGEIGDIISDISDRINLLSLNAAIEAARAGEAGRGFSVVADQIANLADQTAESITNIRQLILKNEEQIREGQKNIQAVVATLSDIIEGIGTIEKNTRQVEELTHSQNALKDRVNERIDGLQNSSDLIQRSMAEQQSAISEIADSIGQVSGLMQSVKSSAESFREDAAAVEKMADHLEENIQGSKQAGSRVTNKGSLN